MPEINWTETRQHMLTEALKAEPGEHGPALACVNKKRAIWRPVLLDLDIESKPSRAESRALGDLWGCGALETPDWQGDMDVYRTLQITEAGKKLLAQWTWDHGAKGGGREQ